MACKVFKCEICDLLPGDIVIASNLKLKHKIFIVLEKPNISANARYVVSNKGKIGFDLIRSFLFNSEATVIRSC